MVQDRLVIWCHVTKTREKLIQEGSDLTLEKAIDIARTDEMSKTQLETMANEDASINTLNQRKPKTEWTPKKKKWTLKIKKYRVKSVINVDINMARTSVTQKESDVPSAKSWTILQGFAVLSQMPKKEYT